MFVCLFVWFSMFAFCWLCLVGCLLCFAVRLFAGCFGVAYLGCLVYLWLGCFEVVWLCGWLFCFVLIVLFCCVVLGLLPSVFV